jgi:predicted small metal-binding protein
MTGYKADLKQVCGCGINVQGQTKDELVGHVKTHAKEVHKIDEVPQELAAKLMAAIKEA